MKQNHITVFVFGNHPVSVKPSVARRKQTKHPIENNPLVQFEYPKSDMPWVRETRQVRLIGANARYFVGLEVSDKNRFKKFLRNRASGFQFLSFNQDAIA